MLTSSINLIFITLVPTRKISQGEELESNIQEFRTDLDQDREEETDHLQEESKDHHRAEETDLHLEETTETIEDPPQEEINLEIAIIAIQKVIW